MDYISPPEHYTLFASLKASHFLISSVVAGTILIKVMTILSTGLFVAANVPIEDTNATLLALDQFVPNGTGLDAVDDRAAIIVHNLFTYNSLLPLGTTQEYAYPVFKATSDVHYSSVTGSVDVFYSDLECETANMTARALGEHLAFDLTTPSCNTSFYNGASGFVMYGGSEPDSGSSSTSFFARCENNTSADPEWRFFVVITDYVWANYSANISSSFNLVCKPQYNLGEGIVSLTPDSLNRNEPQTIAVSTNDTRSQIDSRISTENFGQAVYSSLSNATNTLLPQGITAVDLFSIFPATSPDTNWTRLRNPGDFETSTVEAAFLKAHTLVSAQVAKRYFMATTEQELRGNTTSVIPRLLLRDTAFWPVESILILCLALSLFLIFQPHSLSSPVHSSSINCMAMALSINSSLTHPLSGTGTLWLSGIRSLLADRKFFFHVSERSILQQPGTKSEKWPENEIRSNEDLPSWYRPFVFTWTSRVLLIAIPLGVLVGLEATLQYSRTNDGIADVSQDQSVHFAWYYIPAVIMAGIGLASTALDFSVKLLSPYYTLHRHPVSAQLATSEDFLAKTSLHAAITAGKRRQPAIVMASIAAILAPYLTIIVAGVFSPFQVPLYVDTDLGLSDSFSTAKVVSAYPGYITASTMGDPANGMTTAMFVMTANLSYPRWTHDVFAFPHVGLSSTADVDGSPLLNQTGKRLRVTVPAIRAVANCSLLPEVIDDSVTSNHTRLETLRQWFVPNVTKPFPLPYPTSKETSPKFPNSNPWENNTSGDGYFGYWFADQLVFDEITIHPDGSWSPHDSPLPSDFPRALAVFGEVRSNITASVTALYCKPYIVQINTETQFLLPSFDFDPTFPPHADPSTQTVFSNASYTELKDVDSFNIPDSFMKAATSSFTDLTEFTALTVYGLGGTPMRELVGADNVDTLIDAIDHTYGMYMAQVLNTQRETLADAVPLTGKLVNPTRLRLQQDEISTRVLEALLAAIALFTLAAYALTDAGRVLPKNPCSIAAFTSLVADSEWLRIVRERVEKAWGRGDVTDEEFEKKVMEGLVLSMGWWGEPGERRFGIDVGQADKEKEG